MNSKYDFTKQIEKLVDPISSGTIHFMQNFTKLLPLSLQTKIIKNSGKKNKYMGFIVDPYATFLCYEITDLEYAKSLIDDNYELVKTSIFDDDEEKYYAIFSCFNVRTSAFYGSRMEFNIVARNKDTGLISWVIVDHDTNTISYDASRGLTNSTVSNYTNTTDYNGNIIVDLQSKENDNKLIFDINMQSAVMKNLDQGLWLEGNFSVAYGKEHSSNNGDSFSLKFNPQEVSKAFELDKDTINIEVNNYFPGLFNQQISKVVTFPFAQHYLSDSPGHNSNIKDVNEMKKQISDLDFNNIPTYSVEPILRSFKISAIVSWILTTTLICLLIWEYTK